MGDEHFDELLKRLEAGRSRRGMVRGTVAGLGASLAAILTSDGIDALRKRKGDNKKKGDNKNKKRRAQRSKDDEQGLATELTPETITEADVQADGQLCEISWVAALYPSICNPGRRRKNKRKNKNNNNNNNKNKCRPRCKRDERCVKGKCRRRPVS